MYGVGNVSKYHPFLAVSKRGNAQVGRFGGMTRISDFSMPRGSWILDYAGNPWPSRAGLPAPFSNLSSLQEQKKDSSCLAGAGLAPVEQIPFFPPPPPHYLPQAEISCTVLDY